MDDSDPTDISESRVLPERAGEITPDEKARAGSQEWFKNQESMRLLSASFVRTPDIFIGVQIRTHLPLRSNSANGIIVSPAIYCISYTIFSHVLFEQYLNE
jgi:hypothetical protein